jgi:hypothetical protein
MNMKKKIMIFSSLAIAFLLVALTTITFGFNQQPKEEGYKIVAGNIHCEKATKHCCDDCKDCCGMPDCCKDGKCSNGCACCESGACCESCCEPSSKESAENSEKTDDCCESGASCCNGGACCKKQQEKQS